MFLRRSLLHARCLPLFLSGFLAPEAADAQNIPAFPGAAGYGGYARGGRGGDVYIVTNLENKGEGSFAHGIETVPPEGRTIVFEVSGHIPLPSGSRLRLTKDKVTIAGQTAPGDGVCLTGGTFLVSSDDLIVRHVRFRYRKQKAGGDCLNLDSNSENTIFDHVALQFGTDENMSSFKRPPENMTMQWSLNAWGLETHSCGGLWDQNHATAQYNLWAHNHTRNPKARPNGLLDWVNNVTFDWDIGFIMGDSQTPADWKANVRGNYFICPPGNIRPRALEKANLDREGKPNFTLFLENNLIDNNGNKTLDGKDEGYGMASGEYAKAPRPLPNAGSAPLTIDPPLTAYKKIVSAAGPLRMDSSSGVALRDEVDTILIDNLVNLRRHHVKSESETGASNDGIGTLKSTPPAPDRDRDGMPDFWEQTTKSNPAAADHNKPVPSSGGVISGGTFFPPKTPAGYTLLEEYLHFRANPHAVMPKSTAAKPATLTVDLARYTSGFNEKPVFAVGNAYGGTATLSNGREVRFTPAPDFSGRAGFDFIVQDASGSRWTQSFYVLVSAAP